MNEIKITDSGVDESFKGGASNALDNSGPQKTGIVPVHRASPSTTADSNDGANDESVALSPNTTRGDKKNAGDTGSE
jgi:hypothetical protein